MKKIVLTLSALCLAPCSFATGLLVPAYFYPSGAGATDWSLMDAASSSVDLTAILNPDSGPGSSTDPNILSAVNSLRAAGGHDVGYIYTDYGSTPLATVENEVSSYLSMYPVSGFFFDGMSGDPSEHSYYKSLYDYAKGLSSAYTVIDNPGTSFDESDASDPVADTFIEFEGSASDYTTATPASWTSSYPASLFAATIYGAPTLGSMLSALSLAQSRNVGSVFVTDQNLPNPYNQLPSYWDQEVAAIHAMPEPQPFAVLGLGLGAMVLRRRARRRAE